MAEVMQKFWDEIQTFRYHRWCPLHFHVIPSFRKACGLKNGGDFGSNHACFLCGHIHENFVFTPESLDPKTFLSLSSLVYRLLLLLDDSKPCVIALLRGLRLCTGDHSEFEGEQPRAEAAALG